MTETVVDYSEDLARFTKKFFDTVLSNNAIELNFNGSKSKWFVTNKVVRDGQQAKWVYLENGKEKAQRIFPLEFEIVSSFYGQDFDTIIRDLEEQSFLIAQNTLDYAQKELESSGQDNNEALQEIVKRKFLRTFRYPKLDVNEDNALCISVATSMVFN